MCSRNQEEGLPYAAQLRHLLDGELDSRLNTPVGIFFQPVAHFDETDRRSHHQLAATRLLVARREELLAQEIELVLVQAFLQA